MSPNRRPTAARAAEIFASLEDRIYRQTDRLFLVLMSAQWVVGVAAALWVSPRTWAGAESTVHPHVWAALILGGALSGMPMALALRAPGRTATRYTIAVSQMLMSSLLIHVTGGRIESHFHIFGSLAFIAFYRDWRLLVPATAVVVGDHLLRGMFWPQSIYGVLHASWWRTLEHAGWVVFEDVVLVFSCIQGRREMWRLASQTADFDAGQERYRAMVEQTAESIVVFDAATREVLEFNQSFANRVGSAGVVAGGLRIDESTLAGHGDGSLGDEIEAVVRNGRPVMTDRTLRLPGGTGLEVSCSLSRTTFGGRAAVCAVLHDITDRKRVEAEVTAARDAAIEQARIKSEFLANMSHEIRTPMNGVVGMAGLLLETPLSGQQREFAETIQSSADSLLTIINDILDFSKVESGNLQFDVTDFDLRQALDGALDLLSERAHGKGLELALLIEPDVPTELRGDPGRLRQIVLNLVGNAVKFTDRGEVVLRVSREEPPGARACLRFEIRDTGIGIPEAVQARLFQAFVQADGSTTRKYGGTGLGLAISRRLVELMHGRIGVTSTPGDGATFWFTATFDLQVNPGRAVKVMPVPLAGRRVLVVDDNETNRRVLHYQLALWGVIDTCVADAATGLTALRAAHDDGRPFDVVVLDCQMPDVDGLTLARQIRDDPALAALPLVMMTSLGDFGDTSARESLRLAACLFKPVKAAQFQSALASALGLAALPHDAPLTAPPVAPQIRARILVAEDNIVNQKVALLQLKRLGCTADAVANGAEAVAALARIPYDLVLMDCQMPEVDGFEATRIIRASHATYSNIPIIAMTANALAGDRERCLAAGMNDYVSKPVNTDGLAIVLARWYPAAAEV